MNPADVPLRPAATVMLVRDGESSLEVFMLRRSPGAVFAGGLYVFPGGRVDDADAGPEIERLCRDRDDASASETLGVSSGGLAYWVSAVRECFEEAGVLLAAGPEGIVRFDDPTVAARFARARKEVHGGALRLVDLLATEELVITADLIEYVSHWITPMGQARRFDTRFFLARAPEAQEPLHDDTETVESMWIRPGDALEQHKRRDLELMPPTRVNLEFLADFESADDALASARALPPPLAIQPRIRIDGDGRATVVLPDDPEYATLPDPGGPS